MMGRRTAVLISPYQILDPFDIDGERYVSPGQVMIKHAHRAYVMSECPEVYEYPEYADHIIRYVAGNGSIHTYDLLLLYVDKRGLALLDVLAHIFAEHHVLERLYCICARDVSLRQVRRMIAASTKPGAPQRVFPVIDETGEKTFMALLNIFLNWGVSMYIR